MSKKSIEAKPERTSADVAHIAGQFLNGKPLADAEQWLQQIADAEASSPYDRQMAAALLGTIGSLRRVAASALTQR